MNGSKLRDIPNYQAYEEMNVAFYKHLLKWISDSSEVQLYSQAMNKQKQIEQKLSELSRQETLQWTETICLKYRQIYNSHTSHSTNQLFSTLCILVNCCKKFKIPYDYMEVNKIIKETYYDFYKDKIVELFKKSGFDTQEFQVFEYQDPLLTKVWRFFFQ